MKKQRNFDPKTLAVHAGARTDQATKSPRVPIYRTTAFAFDSVEEMADTFSGLESRYIYSRYGNPSNEEAEHRLAALEGAEGALTFASGMAAITTCLLTLLGSGDHVLAQRELYGGTSVLLSTVLRKLKIDFTLATAQEIEANFSGLLQPETKLIFLETPANPTLEVVDLSQVCAKAGERGIPVLVDNTFATPINQQPLRLGASIVVHSASKYLSGHGDLIAGAVACSQPFLSQLAKTRKETGPVLDPEAAWILARSLATLPLRVQAQNSNAGKVAVYLQSHPAVDAVNYPGLPTHPTHRAARSQMRGFGGIVAFEVKGGAEAVSAFVDNLTFIRMLPTLGGVETSITIPAQSSHSMVSDEARRKAGIGDGLVRLSLGIEEIGDIIWDLENALTAAREARQADAGSPVT